MTDRELTFMIVEDNPEFALLLKSYLGKVPKLTHIGTYDGTTEAVLNIERQKPDIIFLDINISGLEGPEFVELLEHMPQVIVISGHPEEIMRNFSMSYADYIQKPPTVERLQAAVEKCRANLS
jgi:two-component SAPR family response regulator